MGLTRSSVGSKTLKENKIKRSENSITVALAGNPNVGKSSVFNALTGLRQHTGNWTGKTVVTAQGTAKNGDKEYVFTDIPGAYSFCASSPEEKTARDFIMFGNPDLTVVVCDATCLERSLGLVLQTAEMSDNVIVCVNLIDEAHRRGIVIDLGKLSEKLGVNVVGCTARDKKSVRRLLDALEAKKPLRTDYGTLIESAVDMLIPHIKRACTKTGARFTALRLLENDESYIQALETHYPGAYAVLLPELERTRQLTGLTPSDIRDATSTAVSRLAEKIASECTFGKKPRTFKNVADKILTGKYTAFPCMLLMLAVVFWLTVTGANYPSALLQQWTTTLENIMYDAAVTVAPVWLCEMLIHGVYRVTAWIVSVMLPPMAIFFPLFTLLEDLGVLPRIAFNLDRLFKRCSACGKQALTMCMGFGCNAAGVVGCRIIDSPRERMIAILTNNIVPCNGRFPTLIALITVFFVFGAAGITQSAATAVILAAVIVFAIMMTLAVSWVLSKTVLRGVPSSFTLELPPYRRPQFFKILVRSLLDRTLFVLGRAVVVAIPAGLIIWIAANVTVGDMSILGHVCAFLDPAAKLFGIDGVILTALILGLPANEIVLPLILTAYTAQSSLTGCENLAALRDILLSNGWTMTTAVCLIILLILRTPCTTTLMTIWKETKSVKWTAASALIAPAFGFLLCLILTALASLL